MGQMNFDSYMDGEEVLIHCPLTSDFHWIRITSGRTPPRFRKQVQFMLDGYDFMYVNKTKKDEIVEAFDGSIVTITWEEAMGYDEQSETEQSDPAVATRNDS